MGNRGEMVQPVDIVIAWVDGNDQALKRKRHQFLTGEDPSDAISDTRFASNDEIYFNIASILKYVPFCRNIYVVTDQQRPAFIDEFANEIGKEKAYRMMSNFKCERVPALEYFLTRDYNGRIKPYIVWDDSKNIIVAYFTLITTCMILKPYEKTDPEHTKEKDVEKIISCIELEHFALNDVYLKLVNEDGYSNSGIGNYVFKEYISTVIAVLVSEVNFFYLILHAYNNDKVINAYRNMGFETMEDDAEAVIPTLSDVRALHSDYAGDCKFMFRDVESILTDLD